MSEVKQVWQSLTWLNRNLLLELTGKGKVCGHWKQGEATQEDNRDAVCHCRENVCVAKA